MPARSIVRRATVVPSSNAVGTSAPIYVDSDDDALKIVPAGTGTTERVVGIALSTSGFRFTAGTGTLVSGTVVVATGLATVLAFTATISGSTGFATGATEVSGIKVGSITTGAVTVTGTFNSYVTGAATLSASGTGVFNWFAVGT